MTEFSRSVVGVTGASGHLGRAVIGYLKARGATRIVAISRTPAQLADIDNIEVRAGDFSAPDTLDAAFRGIERLLIVSTDTIGSRIAQHTAAIDAAERASVNHLLYTSIVAPYPHDKHLVSNDHFWTEARLFRFPGGWTVLRDNLYADLVLWDAQRTIDSGKLVHASGSGRRSIVSRDDIAATAAGALLTATGRELVDVTGPEALSFADIAAILSRISGKPVEAVGLSLDAYRQGLLAAGLPEALVEAYAGFEVATARGALAATSDAVRRFAGREPASLEALLRTALGGA